MKVAVVKIGARISFGSKDTSGGNGEARSIVKMLQLGGAETHVFTKILKKDTLLPELHWHNIEEDSNTDGFDALVCINGNANFFGGAEDPVALNTYKMINNFKGPVTYVYCDPALTFRQIWSSVEKKPWGSKWAKEDILVQRNDIHYICQSYNTDAVRANFGKNEIIPATIDQYPFEKFPCLNPMLEFNEAPQWDLSYGGTMRGGRREKKLIDFYFGHHGIDVEVFGKITLDAFNEKKIFGLNPPSFGQPVLYSDFIPYMNKAMAHCVIGDAYYGEVDIMSQRAYEAVWAKVVTFMDVETDRNRRVFGADKELADFLYVRDRGELNDRVKLIKADSKLRRQIVDAQIAAVGFNDSTYCKGFVDLVNKVSGQ